MLDIFDNLCILLAKAEQKHYLYTKRALEEAGLEITPGQLIVLYALYRGDGIPITELGKKVFLDNSTLTGLIDRLERSGLVFRKGAPEDRRSYYIYLTEKAFGIQNKIMSTAADIQREMTAGCTDEEITVFKKVLLNIFSRL